MCGSEQSREFNNQDAFNFSKQGGEGKIAPRLKLPFDSLALQYSSRSKRENPEPIITPFYDNGYRFFNQKKAKEGNAIIQQETYHTKWSEIVIVPKILNTKVDDFFKEDRGGKIVFKTKF